MDVMRQFIASESSKKVYDSDIDNYHWAIAFFTNYTGITQLQKFQNFQNANTLFKSNSHDSTTAPNENPPHQQQPSSSFDISGIAATLNKTVAVSIFQRIEVFFEQKQWLRLPLAIKAAKEMVLSFFISVFTFYKKANTNSRLVTLIK
jgi:hypothetical protein